MPLNPGPEGIFEWPEWGIFKSALTAEAKVQKGSEKGTLGLALIRHARIQKIGRWYRRAER